MNRTINVFRRRTNIVDMMVPLTSDVAEYRLKWAQNFDAGVWTTIIQASNAGFFDDTIDRSKVESQPSTGVSVRMTFDPATFSIDDTKSFWIQLWHYPPGGPEVQMSAPSLILPDGAHHGIGLITLQGTAPSGATSADALQLDLPRLMRDFRIHNEDAGATVLYVSTEQGGSEVKVKPTSVPDYTSFSALQGSIWVRGGGATVAFSATCTLALPR